MTCERHSFVLEAEDASSAAVVLRLSAVPLPEAEELDGGPKHLGGPA